jgi:hypothetical protein
VSAIFSVQNPGRNGERLWGPTVWTSAIGPRHFVLREERCGNEGNDLESHTPGECSILEEYNSVRGSVLVKSYCFKCCPLDFESVSMWSVAAPKRDQPCLIWLTCKHCIGDCLADLYKGCCPSKQDSREIMASETSKSLHDCKVDQVC